MPQCQSVCQPIGPIRPIGPTEAEVWFHNIIDWCTCTCKETTRSIKTTSSKSASTQTNTHPHTDTDRSRIYIWKHQNVKTNKKHPKNTNNSGEIIEVQLQLNRSRRTNGLQPWYNKSHICVHIVYLYQQSIFHLYGKKSLANWQTFSSIGKLKKAAIVHPVNSIGGKETCPRCQFTFKSRLSNLFMNDSSEGAIFISADVMM